MSTSACCTLPAVVSDYQPTGNVFHIDGMEVYEVGSQDITTAVLVFPDIFGLTPQVKQVRAYHMCAA